MYREIIYYSDIAYRLGVLAERGHGRCSNQMELAGGTLAWWFGRVVRQFLEWTLSYPPVNNEVTEILRMGAKSSRAR